MNPYTQKTINAADAKLISSAWNQYARNQAAFYKQQEDDEKKRLYASQELQSKINSGELNPDGTPVAKRSLFEKVADKFTGNNPDVSGVDVGRLAKVKSGMQSGKSREDIMRSAGIGEGELNAYLHAAGDRKYKDATAIKKVGKFVGEVADDIGTTIASPFITLDPEHRKRMGKGMGEIEDRYKRGEISYSRFKEEFDEAKKGQIGFEFEATQDGIKRKSLGKQIGSFAGEFTEAGATFAAGPGSFSTQLLKQGGKQFLKEGLVQSAKYGAREAALTTTADLTGQALQEGAGVLTIENALKSYGANALLGAAGDFGGKAASGKAVRSNIPNNLDKAIRDLPESALTEPNLQRLNDAAGSAKSVKDFRKTVDEIMEAEKAKIAKRESDAAFESSLPKSRSLDEIEAERKAVESGEDESLARYISNEGTDLTDQVKAVDKEIQQLRTSVRDLKQQAEGVDPLTGRSDIPEGVDPSSYTGDAEGRAKAIDAIPEMEARIKELEQKRAASFELNGGVQRVIDPKAARTRMKELNSERQKALDIEVMRDNTMTPEKIEAEIKQLDGGIVPDRFLKSRAPAATPEEALERAMRTDTQDSTGIQRTMGEAFEQFEASNTQLQRMMTTDRYNAELAKLDEGYRIQEEQSLEMAAPRKAEFMEMLNQDYMAKKAQLDEQLNAQSGRVAELEQARDVVSTILDNAMHEWNSIEASNPKAFADVDTDMLNTYRESLTRMQALNKLAKSEAVTGADRTTAIDKAVENTDSKAGVESRIKSSEGLQQAVIDEAVEVAYTSGKTNVNIADAVIFEPRTVFGRWGTAGKEIVSTLSGAIDDIRKFKGDLTARSIENNWRKTFGKKYADQTVEFLDKGTPLKKLDSETDAHFKMRQNSVADQKKWFQEVGRKMGLPEDMVLKDYLPHIIERETGLKMDDIAQAMLQLKEGKTPNGRKLSQAQKNKLLQKVAGVSSETRQMIAQKNLYTYDNGHLKRRHGADGWTRDLETIYAEYSRSAAKEIHMKPALEKLKAPVEALENNQKRMFDEWVANWKGDRRDGIEGYLDDTKIIGTDVSLKDVIGGTRRLQNVALMGASARTIIMQTGSIKNIYVDSDAIIPAQFTMSGIKSVINSRPGSPLRMEAMREGVFADSYSSILTGGKGMGRRVSKAENALYGGITYMDETMRLWAYDLGKHNYAKGLGKPLSKLTPDEMKAARKAGADMARNTLFDLSELGIPTAQNTTAGKLITQLQQFNIKQTAYELKTLYGKDAKSMFHKDADGNMKFSKLGAKRVVKNLIGWSVLIGGFTSASSAIFGEEFEKKMNLLAFKPEDFIPFGEQVVGAVKGEFTAPTAPLISAVFGNERGDGILDYVSAYMQYQNGDIDKSDWEGKLASLPKFLARNFVPMGTQAVRSLEGYETLDKGRSENAYGQTRFAVHSDEALNIAKGLIGGQYATDEGRKWIQDGAKSISDKHKVEIEDGVKVPVNEFIKTLSAEDQGEYVEYYLTKQKAERALKKTGEDRASFKKNIQMRFDARTLTLPQANREIDRWNSKLMSLYAPYMSGRQNIPARLTDDFIENEMLSHLK